MNYLLDEYIILSSITFAVVFHRLLDPSTSATLDVHGDEAGFFFNDALPMAPPVRSVRGAVTLHARYLGCVW